MTSEFPTIVVVQSSASESPSADFNEFFSNFLTVLRNGVSPSQPIPESPVDTVVLKTKYYSAEVKLCRLTLPDIGTEVFADAVEAVVVHFSPVLDPDLQKVDQWYAFIKHWEPSVCILVCDRIPSAQKVATADWCVAKGFELVELNPDEESVAEAKGYGEEIGLARAVQILKAHSWSNLELLDDNGAAQAERLRQYLAAEPEDSEEEFGDFHSATMSSEGDQHNVGAIDSESNISGATLSCFSDNFSDHKNSGHSADYAHMLAMKCTTATGILSPVDSVETTGQVTDLVSTLDSLHLQRGAESSDEQNFDSLFQMFGDMKTKADALPVGRRKEYAEQMVMAYWNAIGGDPTELEGLDHSGESDEN